MALLKNESVLSSPISSVGSRCPSSCKCNNKLGEEKSVYSKGLFKVLELAALAIQKIMMATFGHVSLSWRGQCQTESPLLSGLGQQRGKLPSLGPTN